MKGDKAKGLEDKGRPSGANSKAGDTLPKAVVIKVGGSCLANGKTIKAVVEKIGQVRERDIIPVIVVSALKGMTNSLLEIITNSHRELENKDIDRMISEGEQLSVKVLHSALKNAGIESSPLLLSDSCFPIITDSEHGNANVILEDTEQMCRDLFTPLIKKGVIPVVPGFVGKTKEGEITTLGRGGSDTTAILLGKVLDVQEVILLKDVPGILSGDSKILKSTKKLSTLTVEETLNLGIRGGEVLCPFSLMYKPKDVKLRVVNFDNGDILESGTEITGELENRMKVVVDSKKKAAITVIGNKMNEIPGLLTKFSGALTRKGINIFSVSASDFSICFYVDMKDQVKALEVLHEIVINTERLSAVTSMPDISLITIVGKDFGARHGVLGMIGDALSKEGINIIDISTSMCEADIFVSGDDAMKAKKALEVLF